MKDSFTMDEIKGMLNKALAKSQIDADQGENDTARFSNKAWNRGVMAMFNRVLCEMYELVLEADAK